MNEKLKRIYNAVYESAITILTVIAIVAVLVVIMLLV